MAELATIARPYAEALFKVSGSDLGAAASWLKSDAWSSNFRLQHLVEGDDL